jgi:hypothetical protein
MSDEQLAINAQMAMQGKGGNLSDKQMGFVNDILTSFQMLMQLSDWEKQYGGAPAQAPGAAQPSQEKGGQPIISNPPKTDSPKK